MKKVKKILCLCLATCMLSIGTGVTAFAEESKEMVFGDDYVPQSLVNYSIDDLENNQTKQIYDITEIVVSKAVVKGKYINGKWYGHTFLICENNTSDEEVTVYEQTPNQAQCKVWTYDELADGKYLPFEKKE